MSTPPAGVEGAAWEGYAASGARRPAPRWPAGGPIVGDDADTGAREEEMASASGGSGGAAGGD